MEAHTKTGGKSKWYEPLCDEAHTKAGEEGKWYASLCDEAHTKIGEERKSMYHDTLFVERLVG